MIDDLFVLDAVMHAHNQRPESWADPVRGESMIELANHLAVDSPNPQYGLTRHVDLSDWQALNLANLLLRQSDTDNGLDWSPERMGAAAQ